MEVGDRVSDGVRHDGRRRACLSPAAVIPVYGIPITTLILRNYYVAIPNDLVEAAKMDGAGVLHIYGWIMCPLLPGFVVVGLLAGSLKG